MEELNNEIDDIVQYIKNSSEYKKCILLKEQMNDNDEIKFIVDEIKTLQKKYIRSNYDDKIKKELDKKNEILSNIPIYNVYNQSLDAVNAMIDYVRNRLNDYFEQLTNSKRN